MLAKKTCKSRSEGRPEWFCDIVASHHNDNLTKILCSPILNSLFVMVTVLILHHLKLMDRFMKRSVILNIYFCCQFKEMLFQRLPFQINLKLVMLMSCLAYMNSFGFIQSVTGDKNVKWASRVGPLLLRSVASPGRLCPICRLLWPAVMLARRTEGRCHCRRVQFGLRTDKLTVFL